MERTFLVLASLLAFVGVGLGAFGAHALRSRLDAERLARFETGVRYHLWHALALFAVVFVDAVRPATSGSYAPLVLRSRGWLAPVAGWLFVAGIVLFSGSLYALAFTGKRRWGAVAPFGGVCFLLGWLMLAFAAWVA